LRERFLRIQGKKIDPKISNGKEILKAPKSSIEERDSALGIETRRNTFIGSREFMAAASLPGPKRMVVSRLK
jgi:hypothetical protein